MHGRTPDWWGEAPEIRMGVRNALRLARREYEQRQYVAPSRDGPSANFVLWLMARRGTNGSARR